MSDATILVVDDTADNLNVLGTMLGAAGYDVRLLPGAELALRSIEAELPDLILLDIRMPGMDGYALCERLKATPRTREIPIIFISALQEAETIVKAFEAGGVDYVSKPFRAEEVLARVATHLRLRSLQHSLQLGNRRLSALLNSAGEGILGLDDACRITFVNPRALELLGYDEADLQEVIFHDLVHHTLPGGKKHPLETCPILRTIRDGGTRFIQDDQFFCKDGTAAPVEYTVSSIAEDGQRMGIILFRDVTERRRIERQLKEAAAVFELSSEGITLTDAQGTIRRINPAFSEITGYTPQEVIGLTPRILKSEHHPAAFYKEMWRKLIREGYWEGEIWNRRKNGSIYPEWEMITAIRDEQGKTVGYISQFSDITRRKLTEEEIRYRGNYDALTGLVNRTLLLERLELALREHRRKARKLSLLFIDLDKFKAVNDVLGHAMGDALLRKVAEIIGNEVRDVDTVARLGGDEFVIMLTDQENQTPSERIASHLLTRINEPFNLDGKQAQIGASIGIAVFPDDGDTVELLLRNADLAMYRAKEAGRHQVQFFTEAMEREFLERNRLETDLKSALRRGEFTVCYQPITDLRSRRPVGVEALMRWDHPELGRINPDVFIPIAEESGLITAMGDWMIETVCRLLALWQRRGAPFYVSVNVSPHQIPRGIPVERLEQLVREAGISSDRLVLEITENVFVHNVEAVAEWLRSVRAAGFRVYLDDFGTGYSSLSYLQSFPVDAIKIDKSFIREMIEGSADQPLVRAIVAMSEGLGLKVVAEGVETEAQRAMLDSLNCGYGQGYLFSRPIPEEQLESLLFPQSS